MAELVLALSDYQGLIGAVVGGVLGYLASWRMQSRSWQREDRFRGYEFRRDAYAEMLAVANRIVEGETGEEVFQELRKAWINTKLVTHTREVIDSSDQLMVAMGLLATGTTSGLEPGFDPLDEFMTAVRKDLGLPSVVS